MKLQGIELHNFRSYQSKRFCFEEQGAVLIGENGSGKTNLLEAIAYTSTGKSIRYHNEKELITWGNDGFWVTSSYKTDIDRNLRVQIHFSENRKLLKINDQSIKHLSSLMNHVKVIYCAPEDIQLINGSPKLRRQYFDLAISQVFPEYLQFLREYLHIVDQRNNLLKRDHQSVEKRSWDVRFSSSLLRVYSYRVKYLELINRSYIQTYSKISDTIRDIYVNYVPVFKDMLMSSEEKIIETLEEIYQKEKLAQRSLVGAHLDDYHFKMDDMSLRPYGSQGQKRITVIALKMIQARLIESLTGIQPIILFDDIFAELDTKHSNKIMSMTDDRYQVFLASPDTSITEIWQQHPIIQLGASS